MTETQKKIIEELKEQDEVLNKIFERRRQIAGICKTNGDYNEIWEMLFSDGKSHYSF